MNTTKKNTLNLSVSSTGLTPDVSSSFNNNSSPPPVTNKNQKNNKNVNNTKNANNTKNTNNTKKLTNNKITGNNNKNIGKNNKNTRNNQRNSSNNKSSNVNNIRNINSKLGIKILLAFLVLLLVINILVLVYLNFIYRKKYHSIDATVISGSCEDKEGIFGIQKTKCKFKIQYLDPNDSKNGKQVSSIVTDITLADKNKVREDKNNKIIKAHVSHKDSKNVKISRDLPRDNLNLLIILVILVLLILAISYKLYKS